LKDFKNICLISNVITPFQWGGMVMENDDMIMSPGDVAALLQIKESTLRKYALILKDAGYHFQVNGKGQRWYYNRDVIAFKKLLEIKQSPDMTLEQAANAVVSWITQSNVSLVITENERNTDHHNDDITELKEMVNQQTLVIQELVKQMAEQQKHNEERDKRQSERDLERDRQWLEFVRQNQEEKKVLLQIAAAQEEEQKKGFFARLFSR
jgi:DNA-binding transcriptional MerR regulator